MNFTVCTFCCRLFPGLCPCNVPTNVLALFGRFYLLIVLLDICLKDYFERFRRSLINLMHVFLTYGLVSISLICCTCLILHVYFFMSTFHAFVNFLDPCIENVHIHAQSGEITSGHNVIVKLIIVYLYMAFYSENYASFRGDAFDSSVGRDFLCQIRSPPFFPPRKSANALRE